MPGRKRLRLARSGALVAGMLLATATLVGAEAGRAAASATAGSYSNTTAITINDANSASPYPSTITVAGAQGTVTEVEVTASSLSHTFPDDIDVLLQAPGGQAVMLMSDAGGADDVSGINLTFDDDAASSAPDSGPLAAGTYKPTDYDPSENLNAPAPARPYGSTLSTLDGTTPNGDWKLWVQDDAFQDSGSIGGGWALSLTTSAFTVNSTTDGADANTADNACADSAGNCTLRAAIEQANASVGPDVIAFNISGSGVQTITVTSPLPAIADPLIIDGYSQPGSSPNTQSVGFDAILLIELDGSQAGSGYDSGLTFTAGDSTVRGLIIHRFDNAGILITGAAASGNVVVGNALGKLEPPAFTNDGNGQGVRIEDASDNRVGGVSPADRNIISANTGVGVSVVGSSASGNEILGNYIGTDRAGSTDFGNFSGVSIFAAPNTVVGGTSTGAGNVIAGSARRGVMVDSGATGTMIQGNYIGTDADGQSSLDNSVGVHVKDSSRTVIGGTVPQARNVISGNFCAGVRIDGSSSADNLIQGNYIGTDATGTSALPNAWDAGCQIYPGYGPNFNVGAPGVELFGGPRNRVGGTTPTARNVIAGNEGPGIEISASQNFVEGNYIGTDAAGGSSVPNEFGVLIEGSSNSVGGTSAGARNVISGNGGAGVWIKPGDLVGGAAGNLVQGNYIGANAAGAPTLANSGGIYIEGGSNNVIGGTAAGAGNLIAGNTADGIGIAEEPHFGAPSVPALGNQIAGNAIFSNAEIGIDLAADGVTGNDVADADSGPNGFQNFPVLHSAVIGGGQTTVSGALDSMAGTTFALDFYSSPTCDPSGYGEGRSYLGRATAATNGSGIAEFNVSVRAAILGENITATATDPSGNTSELSRCVKTPSIRLSSAGYKPRNVTVNPGVKVFWNFVEAGHTVTDATGLGLFDSGVRALGSTFFYLFPGAGAYSYRCTSSGHIETGTIQVPVRITPKSGTTSTSFSVTWASQVPPGLVYDVQVRRPGQTFQDWQIGTTQRSATFVPDAGVGNYEFRGRLRNPGTGRATPYSTGIPITVT